MIEHFISELIHFKKRTVQLSELERIESHRKPDYFSFAEAVIKLEEAGYIEMVKSKGRNGKNPPLAYTYKIQHSKLKEQHIERIHREQFGLNTPGVSLDTYFSLAPETFEKDLPYIKKIDRYLHENGEPGEAVPAPERSVEIVNDEKWITEKGGKAVIDRLKLWDALRILPVSDPLMMAVNPYAVCKQHIGAHLHLIVENKTTYQGLLPALTETPFSTLTYGAGKKIISSIEQFNRQFPVENPEHLFYYFGDLDYEGISIWHSLNEKKQVVPAVPFYEQCFTKTALKGKTNHRKNAEAVEAFLAFLKETHQDEIKRLLANGEYYAQEVLRAAELQEIWRHAEWSSMK